MESLISILRCYFPDRTIVGNQLQLIPTRSFNQVYQLVLDSRKYIVKLIPANQSDAHLEMIHQHKVAKFGLAPDVLHWQTLEDNSHIMMLQRYMSQSTSIFQHKEIEQRLAVLLSSLHHSAVEFDRNLLPLAFARQYWELALQNGFSDQHTVKIINDYFLKFSQSACQYFLKSVPCHLDLNHSNVLLSDSGDYLIDWECSANSDAFFDIAILFFYLQFSSEQVKKFITHYKCNVPEIKILSDSKITACLRYYQQIAILTMCCWLCYCLSCNTEVFNAVPVAQHYLSEIIADYIREEKYNKDYLLACGLRELASC